MLNSFRSLLAAVAFLALTLPAGAAAAQAARDPLFDTLGAALDKARSEQVDVLSPVGFAAASEAYQTASKDAERGRNPQRIHARLDQGVTALQAAEKSAAATRQLLSAVIRTREDALAAQAPKFAAEAWQKAAERFNEATVAAERNDIRNAQRRSAEAEVLLRDAELIAIKGGILNEARVLIAQAEEAKVGRHAPRSLKAAKRYLAEAEQEIQRNRYDVTTARNLAAQARYEARHSVYLAQLVMAALEQEDDDLGGIEALVLAWEEPLRRVATEMELAADFDAGVQPTLQAMLERALQQRQEQQRRKQELEDRSEEIAALNLQLQRLEARLGGISEERIALQRRVDAQEQLRANVAAVESSFAPDEARVYRQGEDVVISLTGIRFPSGRSTIDAASAPLMNKVRDALARFPGATVSVEGHTDANGSDSANLILSQDRADAVKEYIVANFALDAEKVSSIGYGEARPGATNETAEGRARNRRIDVVIHVLAR